MRMWISFNFNNYSHINNHSSFFKGYLVSHFNVYHSMNLEGYDNLQLTNIFPEECARQCVEQTGFTCRSFEYNTATMECALSEANTAYSGIPMSYKENVDLYERRESLVIKLKKYPNMYDTEVLTHILVSCRCV